ncbi:tetratricopeptide repeat protein [Promicromonospora soli]|uniref:Tetratricopeptide repeat protein n=1 Tax=Promicromonospora soli TaxID=2035533 RepID=A0A919FHN6_9MICO|nr:hypothetical protein [Promicromonospora soli]GHH65107.1 hypothetical protein GCM10017772_02740 [Promicromonospora soli]
MSSEPAPTATPPAEPADAAVDTPVGPLLGTTGETPEATEETGAPETSEAPDEVPADPPPSARPLTAALLNLSGFGLGYLHLRAWVRLVVALAATAGLAWVALPIGREPIDLWWAVGYLGALALFALDAALLTRRRARRPARRRTVWSPRAAGRAAWATLAVVPLLGAAYVVTQHEVLEQHLAYDLDEAEESLKSIGTSFGTFTNTYDDAYATYVQTAADHPDTRAADRVPELIDGLYAQAKDEDECKTLIAVRHFAKPKTPGPLQLVAEDELPGALHDCGMRSTEDGDFNNARPTLEELLANHPASEPAAALPEDLATWRDRLLKKLAAKGGCTDTEDARDSVHFLGGFDSGKVSALADEVRKQVPAGMLKCAERQFQNQQYLAALENLDGLLNSYPRAKETGYAERLQIAAGIANVDPKAGVKLPARTEPEATITLTVYNYSPDDFEMVYTGPATGVVTIDPCDDCTYYAEGDAPECTGYSLTVPSTKVTVPAGSYLTAVRRDGVVTGWMDDGGQESVEKADFSIDGTWYCTWIYKP